MNSCAQGALSDAVRAAYETYLADWDEHGSPWASGSASSNRRGWRSPTLSAGDDESR